MNLPAPTPPHEPTPAQPPAPAGPPPAPQRPTGLTPTPQLRKLIDRMPSMLAYWDRDLRCRFANQAYQHWFGVDPEALIGRTLPELLGPALFALNEPYVLGALSGEDQCFERVVPGPGGVLRNSLAHYLPDIQDGVVQGFLVQVTEITQLKMVQQALHQEQLLREQLEQHARALEALLSERNEMLDVLAHEVRQPLNNSSAALQSAITVLKQAGEQLASTRLLRAQDVLGQVLERIDNTLAVAALLAREGPIERVDTDIDTLVAVAIADMPAEDRSRISVDRVSHTRTALMDLSLMRLAMRNLLSNALRASPPGAGVVVRISDSDAPLALLIEVMDQGPGIDEERLPVLFERGQRQRSTTGASINGMGLGLYITRRVMELHHGQVSLVANSSQGATMRLVLSQATDD